MSQASNVDARIAGAEAGLEVSVAEQWKLGGTLAMPGARTATSSVRCRRCRRWKRA